MKGKLGRGPRTFPTPALPKLPLVVSQEYNLFSPARAPGAEGSAH